MPAHDVIARRRALDVFKADVNSRIVQQLHVLMMNPAAVPVCDWHRLHHLLGVVLRVPYQDFEVEPGQTHSLYDVICGRLRWWRARDGAAAFSPLAATEETVVSLKVLASWLADQSDRNFNVDVPAVAASAPRVEQVAMFAFDDSDDDDDDDDMLDGLFDDDGGDDDE